MGLAQGWSNSRWYRLDLSVTAGSPSRRAHGGPCKNGSPAHRVDLSRHQLNRYAMHLLPVFVEDEGHHGVRDGDHVRAPVDDPPRSRGRLAVSELCQRGPCEHTIRFGTGRIIEDAPQPICGTQPAKRLDHQQPGRRTGP